MKMKNTLIIIMGGLIMGCTGVKKNENVSKHKVGKFEVILLSEGQHQGDETIPIGATPEMLQKYTSQGKFPMAVNAYLLRTEKSNILIDAGYGNELFNNLETIGVDPTDIDKVLITHMHNDHIDGMMRAGVPAFTKAQVYISQPEYDYWMSDVEMDEAREGSNLEGFLIARKFIAAYGDRIGTFQPSELHESGSELVEGVRAIAAYGHTPGHTMYMIESSGEKLLVWGDLTHAMAIQMPHPEISVTYDINPDQARVVRAQVLEYVATNNIPIAGMHIPTPALGRIAVDPQGGYKFTE